MYNKACREESDQSVLLLIDGGGGAETLIWSGQRAETKILATQPPLLLLPLTKICMPNYVP